MKSGRFNELSVNKRYSLLKRWHRYHLRLSRWRPQLIGGLGLGLYMILTSSTCHHFTLSPDFTPLGLIPVGNMNKIALADIDGDGDLDAFVGSLEGDIFYFENDPSSTVAFFKTPVSNPFGFSDIGSYNAPTFADIDGDGDLDAFVGEADGNINFFRNTGSSTIPNFVLDPNSEPFGIYNVGEHSTPFFADIDGDGDLDLFIGEDNGRTNFFLNVGTDSIGPYFSERPNAYGLSDVGTRSIPTLADIDGDGDLDAFIGEENGNINFFINNGTSENPSFFSQANSSPFGLFDVGGFSAPVFADIDRDGSLDAFIGEGAANINFFPGTAGEANFSLDSHLNPFELTDVGYRNVPTFVDIDGDGDLDAFIGESNGNINFFRNIDTTFKKPEFVLDSSDSPFGLIDIGLNSVPTFADIDGDGDLDALVGARGVYINVFENIGDIFVADFELNSDSAPLGIVLGGDTYKTPTFVDIDGDGDFDLFMGSSGGGLSFFENDLNSLAANFAPRITTPFGLSNVGDFVVPTFVDIDNDGDFDAFFGESDGTINFFKNNGTSTSASFVLSTDATPLGFINPGSNSAPSFVDIDNDGDMDAFVGERFGEILFFENHPCKSSHRVNHAQLAQDIFMTNEEMSSRAVIRNGREVIFSAETEMVLDTLFEVRDGATFYGLMDGCPL